jgi:Fe-S oxidoreductase
MLWPDTFNNHFHPDTAKAAVEVLEAAGYQVRVPDQDKPQQTLCCGRPLYDYGMLDLAKRKLGQVIAALRPAIREGIPVVGLEPSCISVFRDELRNMLPDDEDAQRLACQTKTISELLLATPGWKAPRLAAKALTQTHCHHKAVLDAAAQKQMFEAMGLDLQPNPTGCCGHAGSFGYEAEHYPVSMTIAEQALLPAVRSAAADTLIIADGFSCREQIRHGARRNALHPVEVLELALCNERITSAREIEQRLQQQPATVQPAASIPALAAITLAGGLALWVAARNRSA